MLFPLMVGVGAGIALERYYFAKQRSKKFWEKMEKDAEKKQNSVEDETKDGKTTESIMDYINKAKKSHPQVVPRREAAIKLMKMLEGKEDGTISQETFEKTKVVVEEYCGIRNLEYTEASKTIYHGEINEECPETPILDVQKLECLTKEELILIAPKLKDLFATETESEEKE